MVLYLDMAGIDIDPGLAATFVDNRHKQQEFCFDVDLPEFLDGKLTNNDFYWERLHRIGSIASSKIEGFDDPHLVDAEKRVPYSNAIFEGALFHCINVDAVQSVSEIAGKTVLRHRLNMPLLNDIVSIRTKANPDMPVEKIWADELDVTLKQSLRQGAYQHLMNRGEASGKVFDSALLAALPLSEVIFSASPELIAASFAWLARKAVGQHRTRKMHNIDNNFPQNRLSLFPGSWQPDRFLAFSAYSRMHKLIYFED